jgi:hypothetical protein
MGRFPRQLVLKNHRIIPEWYATYTEETIKQLKASKVLEIGFTHPPSLWQVGWVYFFISRDPLASAPKKSNLPEFPLPFVSSSFTTTTFDFPLNNLSSRKSRRNGGQVRNQDRLLREAQAPA